MRLSIARRSGPRGPGVEEGHPLHRGPRRNRAPEVRVWSCLSRSLPRARGNSASLTNAAETPVAPSELTDRLGQVSGSELGPHPIEENHFGVSDLPQQAVA